MRSEYFNTSALLRTLILTPALAFAAVAQSGGMGGGMMGSQTNTLQDHGMGSALFNAMNMGMGGREMMDGPTVGPDGTAYVIRRLTQMPTTTLVAQYRHELVAINPRDGSARWKLDLSAGTVSEPALAKDGKIFLTLSEFPANAQVGGGMMNPGGTTSATKAKLVVVTSDQFSARIISTLEVESDILSSPRVAADETGGYTVFVTGFERGAMGFSGQNDNDGIAAGEKHLYAFGSDGRLRFRVKLGDARIGIPAN